MVVEGALEGAMPCTPYHTSTAPRPAQVLHSIDRGSNPVQPATLTLISPGQLLHMLLPRLPIPCPIPCPIPISHLLHRCLQAQQA